MKRTIQVRIFRAEQKYVAECLDLLVVTEAATLDELATNIRDGDFFASRRRRPGGAGFIGRSDHISHHGASSGRLMPRLRTLSGGDLTFTFGYAANYLSPGNALHHGGGATPILLHGLKSGGSWRVE
jgi:hypothetical protein